MFGIGGFELFLILLFGFLVFGPDKLPEIAKTVGRAIAKFRDAQAEMSSTLQNVAFDKNSDAPFKNPFDAADKMKDTAKRSAASAKDAASSVKASVQKPAAKTDADAADETQAAPSDPVASKEPVRESFSERKARYERERAAKAQAARATGAEAQNAGAEKTEAPAASSGDGADAPATPSDDSAKGGA